MDMRLALWQHTTRRRGLLCGTAHVSLVAALRLQIAACDKFSMGAIIFIDELDGLVGSRQVEWLPTACLHCSTRLSWPHLMMPAAALGTKCLAGSCRKQSLQHIRTCPFCREGRMHEATRRLLGVLLQHLDGFNHQKKTGGWGNEGVAHNVHTCHIGTVQGIAACLHRCCRRPQRRRCSHLLCNL